MFAIVFAYLVVMALVSQGCELTMRIRLTRLEMRSEKLSWWRRGGDEVAATYRALFPRSRLPFLRAFMFWFFLALAVVFLLTFILRYHH